MSTRQILRASDSAVLFQGDADSMAELVQQAIDLGVSLAGADLAGHDLRGLRARGAGLTGAVLTGAWLDGSDLSYAGMDGVTVTLGSMADCDLRKATLVAASCESVTFDRSDLTGANLTDAVVTDATADSVVCDEANAEVLGV